MENSLSLKSLMDSLEQFALAIPDVRSCVKNDIVRLNEMRSVEYGVFGITQNEHTYAPSTSRMTYSLNLFYIDRLVNDGENEIEVQSHGIEVLKAVLKRAQQEGLVDFGEARFSVLTQRFQDLCAGAWATVQVSYIESYCGEL